MKFSRAVQLDECSDSVRKLMEIVGKGIRFSPFKQTRTYSFLLADTKLRLEQSGIIPIMLPPFIDLFPEQSMNEMLYFALGVANAAQYCYALPCPETRVLEDTLKYACTQAKKLGVTDAILTGGYKPRYVIAQMNTGTMRDDLVSKFTHSEIAGDFIGCIERARTMSHLFQEYPSANNYFSTLFPRTYFEALKSYTLDRKKVSKEEAFNASLARFIFSTMLHDSEFDSDVLEDYKQRKGDRAEMVVQLRELTREEVGEWVKLAEPGMSLQAKMSDVLKSAVDVYLRLSQKIKQGLFPKHAIFYDMTNMNEISETMQTIRSIAHAQSIGMSDLSVRKSKENAHLPRPDIATEGLHFYPEWDEGKKLIVHKRTAVQMMEWDNISFGWRILNYQRSKQGKSFESSIDMNEEQLPFPDYNTEIEERLVRMFGALVPEAHQLVHEQRTGRLDLSAYAKYRCKRKAGIPVPARYRIRELQNERSVTSCVLVDASESTGDLLNPNYTVLDYLKLACLYLFSAVNACGDSLSVYATTSYPDDKQSLRLTKFYPLLEQGMNAFDFTRRLNHLAPLKGNRDGAIFRHATHLLMQKPEVTKMLIYLSDGEPQDKALPPPQAMIELGKATPIGEPDIAYKGAYAWNDLFSAHKEAVARGITPIIIRVHDLDTTQLKMHGLNFFTVKPDMSNLVDVLSEVYLRYTTESSS
ncbi:hypothetical protein HY486_04775 [Candidatus Woesearchaeota archaeon]|nr:hypothetical protein [Candidatus Woesearchaeota archaeon]